MRSRSLTRALHEVAAGLMPPGATLALIAVLLVGAADVAHANGCAATCRAQHNSCRVATKGSPQCDAQLQACVQRCLATPAPRR